MLASSKPTENYLYEREAQAGRRASIVGIYKDCDFPWRTMRAGRGWRDGSGLRVLALAQDLGLVPGSQPSLTPVQEDLTPS